uniref:DUF4456 domain-containing protein n=1 Tax=Schistocephalus solidus TaxID=70667 RepID=A0A183SEA1_SCHSO
LVALQIRHNPKYHIFGVSAGDPFKDSDPKKPPQRTEPTVTENPAEEGAESSTFIGRVRKICRESLEAGLFLVEFREQMSRLEVSCSRLAKTFFDVLYGRLQRKCEVALESIDEESNAQMKQFDLQREQNYSELHPKLGFPQFVLTEFDKLQSKEERRRHDAEYLLINTLRRKVDVLQTACRDFAQKAPILLESLLLRFDSLVCSNEIQDDDTQLNSEQDGVGNQTADYYRGKRTLPVIDWTEFSNGLRAPARLQTLAQAPVPEPVNTRTSVTHSRSKQFQQKPPEDRDVRYRFSCGKNTEAHAVAIECMRDTMQKFLQYLQAEMQNAEMACDDGFKSSERWSKEWEMNCQLILDLNPLRKSQHIQRLHDA